MPPIEMRDETFSSEGLSRRLLSNLRGVRALSDLVEQSLYAGRDRSARLRRLDRVSQGLRRDRRRGAARRRGRGGRHGAAEGDVAARSRAANTSRPSWCPIPERLAGQQIKLEVASGALVRPDVARPEDLPGFIAALKSYYTASSIVVSLSLPEDGASVRGSLLPNLPPVGPGHPAHRPRHPPRRHLPPGRSNRLLVHPPRCGPPGSDRGRPARSAGPPAVGSRQGRVHRQNYLAALVRLACEHFVGDSGRGKRQHIAHARGQLAGLDESGNLLEAPG